MQIAKSKINEAPIRKRHGPRQVGKTPMALHLLGAADSTHAGYLSWDILKTRSIILKQELPAGVHRVIFDEIHKYKNWRNLLKGYFDLYKCKHEFIVTGSARLDHFRRGGDSLLDRYHYYRLHPLSAFEINSKPTQNDVQMPLEYGGFPEPFYKQSIKFLKRWQNERAVRVIQEDLNTLESVKDISQLDLLVNALPESVGSLLSLNSLREDLHTSFQTVDRWVTILENLYYCFRIQAYGISALRAAKKEKKLYLWDWSTVPSPGARFENLVASQLLKFCHCIQDTEGDLMNLRFIRDSQLREIDFIVLKNKKPLFAVECKTGENTLSKTIQYYADRTNIPKFYQVHLGNAHREAAKYRTEIIPFHKFALELGV
jgi:predicted AAA+ superfamily ATPase